MRDTTRRVVEQIRAKLYVEVLFEVKDIKDEVKDTKDDKRTDFVTEVDRAAQDTYLRQLGECFPDFGIVAEEFGYRTPCYVKDHEIFFTIDGIDGTRAFLDQRSKGIGTAIALVYDGEVIASYTANVLTNELYYYRPESDNTHRLGDFGQRRLLQIDARKRLFNQDVLLRNGPTHYSPLVQRMARGGREGGLFEDVQIEGGSIAVFMMRLWNGDVGGVVLHVGSQKPWDIVPVIGLSWRLGFVFMRIESEGNALTEFEPTVSMETVLWNHETLIVHKSRLEEISTWLVG